MKAVSDNALVSYSKEPHFTHNLNSLIPFMRSEAFCFIGVCNITLRVFRYYILSTGRNGLRRSVARWGGGAGHQTRSSFCRLSVSPSVDYLVLREQQSRQQVCGLWFQLSWRRRTTCRRSGRVKCIWFEKNKNVTRIFAISWFIIWWITFHLVWFSLVCEAPN